MEMSFDRVQLKQNARNILRGCYLNALLFSVLANVLSGILSGSAIFSYRIPNSQLDLSKTDVNTFIESLKKSIENGTFGKIVIVCFIAMIIATLLGYLVNIFAHEHIRVGEKKAYIELRNGNMNLDHILRGFTANYLNVVKAAAIKWLYITVGNILFVIPGIIFSFRYMMVPYILAENPNISPSRALEISSILMKGNKFNAFVMRLSFIGWYLLGTILCCAGIRFVDPYYTMTETELYCDLRDKAIENGLISAAELSGIVLN